MHTLSTELCIQCLNESKTNRLRAKIRANEITKIKNGNGITFHWILCFCSYFSFFMLRCGMSICSDPSTIPGVVHATMATTTTHHSTLAPKKLYIILIRPERNVRQSMMPVRYSAMNKTTGTGPSSMMAAIMVTAATCNQNEKIEKQTTIYPTEDASKLKVLSTGNSYAKQI